MILMGIEAWLSAPQKSKADATLDEVNRRLAIGNLSISREDVRMLSKRRAEALAEAERVEFGTPAIVGIAEATATSPHLSQNDIARDLAKLQDAFYAIRDELPADIPDAEITEALRGCLDEWGDVTTVASLPAEEVMKFSSEYVRTAETEASEAYRIADDEGHAYVFEPADWDYDELADGWNGERWTDDWDD